MVLARRLIEVDGYTFEATDPPGTGVFETLKVRAGAPLTAFTITADTGPVGRLTLVRAPNGIDPLDFEDDSVDRFFDDLVQFVAGEPITTEDGGTFVATNGYPPEWVGVADEFVMHAHNDVDDQARWQWFWDDLLWIVERPASTETVVSNMIGAQHDVASPDPFDTHVIAGELNERFLDAPEYVYWDAPRSEVFEVLPGSIAQQCQEQYLIVIVGEGPEEPDYDAGEFLGVEMALLGNYCTGFEEDFLALFAGGPGGHVETVGSLDAALSARRIGVGLFLPSDVGAQPADVDRAPRAGGRGGALHAVARSAPRGPTSGRAGADDAAGRTEARRLADEAAQTFTQRTGMPPIIEYYR